MAESFVCAGTEEINITHSAKKRKREKPKRKWSDEEVTKILELLLEHRPFEMPCAQIFYKKIMEEAGISADWNLLRWKIRNMKTSYQKAVQWQNSTGVGLLECDGVSSIDQKIARMCPHFDMLHEIFGKQNLRSSAIVVESNAEEDISFGSEILQIADDAIYEVASVPPSCSQISAPERSFDLSASPPSENSKKVDDFAHKMRKTAPKSAVSRLSALKSERNDVHLKRLDFEREKQKEEKELQEKKIRLKEEKFRMERERQEKMIGFEERKLKLDEETKKEELKLRRLELEMKERIARYELELQFKK